MTLKTFEKSGLGKCLIGTYTIRNLTKHFQCRPENLLFVGSDAGKEYEFNSYLLKFSYENALIQAKGAAGLKDKPIEEIDILLDEYPLEQKDFEYIADALCMSIHKMTYQEFADKIKELVKQQYEQENEEDVKKNMITTNTGEELTNSLGETE